MSKVTIKFWDTIIKEYSKKSWLMVDGDGSVYEVGLDCEEGVEYQEHIDTHFYKDGERIA